MLSSLKNITQTAACLLAALAWDTPEVIEKIVGLFPKGS